MLKKRKHKMKRCNTEPQMMALPLRTVNSPALPSSAPPQGGPAPGARTPNLADLCDSPNHATAV